jgi:hypothetical protein
VFLKFFSLMIFAPACFIIVASPAFLNILT